MRRPRRTQQTVRLTDLTTAELEEIYFFSDLVADTGTVTLQASAEEQAEAGRLLRERGGR